MYHVDQYTYEDHPHEEQKHFDIFKLNKPGTDKYLGPDSHVHNYVSRLNPKVFKAICGMDYDSICKEQKEMIERFSKRTGSCPHQNSVKFNENVEYDTNKPIKNLEDTKNEQPQFKETNDQLPCEQTPNNNNMENEKNNYQGATYPVSGGDNYNTYNYNKTYQQQFYPPKTLAHFHKKRNFKDIFGYDKIKQFKSKEQKYEHEIQNLKSDKLANDEFNSSHTREQTYKRKYNGFTSYEIPRTAQNDIVSDKNIAFNSYTRPLKKSLSCASIKNNGENDLDTLRKDNIGMKNTLLYQTNHNFLEKYKLPDISKLANTRKTIRSIRAFNSKNLGEKYDPYSFIVPGRNRTAVNWVGALFQH